jgi:hypothetical protein
VLLRDGAQALNVLTNGFFSHKERKVMITSGLDPHLNHTSNGGEGIVLTSLN